MSDVVSQLLGRGNRLVRPADATHLYAAPHKEFKRLTRSGVMRHLGHGYYVVIPEEYRSGTWRPSIEGAALGVGVADYGRAGAALAYCSAARVHGVIPRALAVATVVIDGQRPDRRFDVGTVAFISRKLDALDLQPTSTDVVDGLVTTREQTALDMAHRPDLFITLEASTEAITGLVPRVDWDVLADLAQRQRRGPAAARVRWIASSVLADVPGRRPTRRVPSLGLRPKAAADPEEFGIAIA